MSARGLSARGRRRLASFSPLCALALVMTVFATPAHAAKQPDLVVAGATLRGPDYAFQGESRGFIAHDTTRNVGRAAAVPSFTAAYLVPASPTSVKPAYLGARHVVRLAPGGQSAGDSEDPRANGYPLGAYWLQICADVTDAVHESNEDNNCTYLKNQVLDRIRVYVIKRVWRGTTSAVIGLGGYMETAKSEDARLVFDQEREAFPGLFEYNFAGAVTYKDSLGTGGCTYSGGGTKAFGAANTTDNVLFDYVQGRYLGGASAKNFFYTITQDCTFTTNTFPGPVQLTFLDMDETPIKFDQDALLGQHQMGSGLSEQHWYWFFS